MFIRRALKVSYRTQLLINNEWRNSSNNQTFPVINPVTEEILAHVQYGSASDISLAVSAAQSAFESGPWRRFLPSQRASLLNKLADLIDKHKEELAVLEVSNTGKPISQVLHFEIPTSAQCYRYFAGYVDKIFGKTIPMNGPFMAYTRHEPIGVVGQIIPWNFPLMMTAWKLAPALCAGCTIVLKPAEQTPLSALKFGELIIESGFPPGVVNIVPGHGDTGAALSTHQGVNKISFTGSTEVGLEVVRSSAVNGLRKVTLELGGKSPNIIFDDANFDLAVAQAQFGIFLNQGQICIAGSRLFVQDGIYDKFVKRLVECTKQKVMGDVMDPKTEQGTMIDKAQFDKVMKYIEIGKQEGAKVVCGGRRWGSKGYFIEPTIFVDVEDHMRIAKEEIFGPVLTVFRFKTVDEVIRRANDSKYGLVAGVFTRDYETAVKATNALKVGTVFVNCYAITNESTPFGGVKQSGYGKELAEEGIISYLETKTVVVKTSDDTLQ